jgi:hypothetical protein
MLKGLPALIAALAVTSLPAAPAHAADDPVSGVWSVHGRVDGFAFVIDCTLKRVGEAVTGVCVDSSSGRRHPILSGRSHGDDVSFTYASSYLVTRFDVTYEGRIVGGAMHGAVKAPGHQGVFDATRR